MRNAFFATVLAAGMALGTGTAAHATDLLGVYVGAGITKAKVDNIFQSDYHLNIDNNTAWKLFAGWKPPLIPIGVEADYMHLGSETRNLGLGTGVHADAKAFAAFAVGYLPLPIPILSIYGKAGLARWQLNGNTQPSLFAIDDQGTDFAWGGGARVHLGGLGVRLEYERFAIRHTDGARLITLGATYDLL